MIDKKFLEDFLNTMSPVGEEYEASKMWAENIKPYVTSLHDDNYGNVWGFIKGTTDYKVGLEFHLDEIAFKITNIDNDGIISVCRNGGSDAMIAPSKTAIIHTKDNGKIRGVFGQIAIHCRKTSDDKPVKMEDLIFDIGVDSKERVLELGIEIGDNITFDDKFCEIGDYYTAKSLDNKIGGVIIYEVARRLQENNIVLPYDLYLIGSTTEEIGLLGAANVAQQLKLDVCLVHDVTHHSLTPGINVKIECPIKSGSGPVLQYTAQNHRKLVQFVSDIAKENNITIQKEVGSYGNDTMSFFRNGSVTMIISSPLKYMHTTVESVHKKDVDSAIDLFYHCLVNLKAQSWKLHNF